MEGQIRRMAAFVDIEIDEAKWPDIVEHCTFDTKGKHLLRCQSN